MRTGLHVRGRLRASALVCGLALVASTASADEPPAEAPPPAPSDAAAAESADAPPSDANAEAAKQHFARARALYGEGDFALARIEFRRAYELSPNYRVLYNIGQVDIQLFDYASARTALEKYLADGGDEIPAARRAQVEADLKMLRGRTAYLQIVSVPPGEVSVDDVPVGKAPFESPLLVNAGRRKVVVSRAGYVTQSRLVTLAGGDRSDLRFDLVAVPERAQPDRSVIVVPQVTTQKSYTPAVLCWIGTGALALGAGITGGLYLSKESEIEEMSDPSRRVSRQDAHDATASATRLAVTADVLGIAAVGAGLAALYFTLRPPHTETTTTTKAAARLRVTPSVNGLRGTF